MKIKSYLKKKEFTRFVAFSLLIFFGFLAGLNVSKVSKLPLSGFSNGDEIGAKELQMALSESDIFLVNVHTPYEGEIEGTDMFVEYNYLKANEDKLPKDKDTEIVLYCQSGRMSKEALTTLKSMGYRNARHLKGGMIAWERVGNRKLDLSNLSDEVLPEEGFTFPIGWGNLGKRLVEIGVIDLEKFEEAMYVTDSQKEILSGKDTKIVIDSQNSRFVVNLLWAAGLAQKSSVYEEGPMGKEYRADIGNFASTGGWTLARGDALNYLGKFDLIPLTDKEQDRIAEIARNVYRPCCGNNTWFPDCNHGMAALSAIELMVSKGLTDDEIYKNMLRLNSYWFPTNYMKVAIYFARQGISWEDVDAKMVLGESYSSARGAGEIAEKVGPLPYELKSVGGSCGA